MLDRYDGEGSLKSLSDEAMLLALNLARQENGVMLPTVAGILLLGKKRAIQKHVPTAQSSFQELAGTRVVKNEDFLLPVLAAIEKMLLYLEARNGETEQMEGAFRRGIPAYEPQALREAVVNAYSHRDYALLGRVRVEVSPNSIVVANPGSFVAGISINDLISAEPHGRNPALADALKRIGLAERTGRGIDRIYEGFLQYGSSPPDYSASTSTHVSVLLPRIVPDERVMQQVHYARNTFGIELDVVELIILNAFGKRTSRSEDDLVKAVGEKEATFKRAVARLQDYNILQQDEQSEQYILTDIEHHYKTQETNIDLQMKDHRSTLVMKLIQQNEKGLTCKEVAVALNVSLSTARRVLRRLKDLGLLETIGNARYTRYIEKNEMGIGSQDMGCRRHEVTRYGTQTARSDAIWDADSTK